MFSFSKAQHSYIKEHEKIATELSKKYHIPKSIILAVAFVETGGGTSKNSKSLNNHFGIIGKNTVNASKYKSFSSVRESYEAFCKLVTSKKYYPNLKGNSNYVDWIKAIASAGYSTQPQEWMRRIQLIIHKFSLNQ